MYDIFNQDPTYGIKDPEIFFASVDPGFLGQWFEIQEAAEKQHKIFFLDSVSEDFDSDHKLYGWLIPYDLRTSFHDPWITSNDYVINNLWKDYECSVDVDHSNIQFNVYSDSLPSDLIDKDEPLIKAFKEIDINKWRRRDHYNKFKDALIPNYSMVVDLDITNFLKYIKKKGYSFTLSMSYEVAKALNAVDEFKYRVKDNKVYLYPQIDPVIRYLDEGSELFKDVKVPVTNTLPAFIETAERLITEQKESFVEDEDLGIVQFSSTPWFSFHSLTPIVTRENVGIPVIVWGKFKEEDHKMILPLYIEVHHAFVDGLHIAKFLEILQDDLNRL